MRDCNCVEDGADDDCDADLGLICGTSFYADGTSSGVNECTD